MKKYRVHYWNRKRNKEDIHRGDFVVEASSPEEAIQMVRNGANKKNMVFGEDYKVTVSDYPF